MPKPLDLRTADNRWMVEIPDSAFGTRKVVDNAYDAWLIHRRVLDDERTIPDQASFILGWNALKDWLQHGLGFEGKIANNAPSGEGGESTE